MGTGEEKSVQRGILRSRYGGSPPGLPEDQAAYLSSETSYQTVEACSYGVEIEIEILEIEQC